MRLTVSALILLAATIAACATGPSPLLHPVPPSPDVPDSFLVRLETSKGNVDILVRRHWSPLAASRFHHLVRIGYYDDTRVFRAVPNFVAQFGLSGDTAVTAAWREQSFEDEPVQASNQRGILAYARGGPNTRTTQVYVNRRDNSRLDTLNGFGFAPFAEVVSDMATVDSLYSGYSAPGETGPEQDSIRARGNAYLDEKFPLLDRIYRARVVRRW